MGEGLANGSPKLLASNQEWRTRPLWRIGLFEAINGHTSYLYDGRVRNFTEAIIWHDGEAKASRDRFLELSEQQRTELITF
jgi:CxxC motif-containing protein (DUF1111 family)